ncbi:MAG: hypothetical protein GXP32_05835 [Kiritimatiellaeota bacterium]|nr:hypothetical protein [Kiritimatiellota bacterium]
MKYDLTVRIQYLVEGSFPDADVVADIKKHALSRGLGGRAGLVGGTVEMTLEGTPREIGEFVAGIHLRFPRNSRIHRIVPVMKTVIESANSEFVVYETESTVEPPLGPLDTPPSVLNDIRNALLDGKVVRINLDDTTYLAADARNAEACQELIDTASDRGTILLFPDIDEIFKHCRFNADVVKTLVSNPKATASLKPGEALSKILAAISTDSDELEVRLADKTLMGLFASPKENSNCKHLEFLLLTLCRNS